MKMRKFCFAAAVAVTCVSMAENADNELVRQEENKRWHFRIGPVMSPRVRVKVVAPRPVLPALPPSGTTTGTGTSQVADPSAGYTDREYVDGYVRPDEGTDDPNSVISDLTWDWGAKDVGAQYSGGRMEFHTDMSRWSETVSSSSYEGGSNFGSDRDILLGVEAVGGWTFFENKRFDAALDAGFRFYGSGELTTASRYGASVTTKRDAFRNVDSYDASGWTDVPTGSHQGTAGGPGRVIGATPTRREELMDSSESYESYRYQVGTSLDYRIWDLRLGPTFGWKITDCLTVRCGIHGLLGLVDAKMSTAMASQNGYFRAKDSKCDAVFGMAAGLSTQLDITESLFLYGGVEYDWWSDKVGLSAGGADACIELSDFSVSVALGIEF